MKIFERLNDLFDIPLDDLVNNYYDTNNSEITDYQDLLDLEDENGITDEQENLDNFEDELADETEQGDPDYQGVIRTVKGAYLVFKRQEADDSFTELWIMNVGKDMKRDFQIRRAILSGTDIDPQTQVSNDEKQQLESYSIGNIQFLKITGLEQ